MAQPLYRDGHVYTIDKGHGLTCFELKTGKKLWDDDNQLTPAGRNPHASIVWLNDGDRVLALNSVGRTRAVPPHPEGVRRGVAGEGAERPRVGPPGVRGAVHVRQDRRRGSVAKGRAVRVGVRGAGREMSEPRSPGARLDISSWGTRSLRRAP